MTDTPNTDDPAAEVERLRGKNRELLGELKAARAELQRVTARASQQEAALRRYEVDLPTERLVSEIAVPGCERLWRLGFEQSFKFVHDGDRLVVRTLEGEPAMLPALANTRGRERAREAQATAEDLWALVDTPELRGTFAPITVGSKATGGGASGSQGGPPVAPTTKPNEPPLPAPPTLGLR
jgi:hypothetical protein